MICPASSDFSSVKTFTPVFAMKIRGKYDAVITCAKLQMQKEADLQMPFEPEKYNRR